MSEESRRVLELDENGLMPCPFCGNKAEMWDGYGTQADFGCPWCGAGSMIQVCDLLDYDQRYAPGNEFNESTLRYPDRIVDMTKGAIREFWNEGRSDAVLARQVEALEAERGWRPIESAPIGPPSRDVGHRCVSDWFLALRKDGAVLQIRRASSQEGHDWESVDETYYTNIKEQWFTHWKPLPEPPK